MAGWGEAAELGDGWQAASCQPDACAGPHDLDGLTWRPARVPGTAAGVLADAGAWRPGDPVHLDGQDWWFRTSFAAEPPQEGERVVLALDGIATVAEVHLNGECVLTSESMFAAHAVDVGDLLRDRNELAIRCRALSPLLRVSRRPRARWRTRLVADGALRFFRTMLVGRAPGFAPGPAAVGPWRPVRLERRRLAVERLALRPRVDGDQGTLDVAADLRGPGGVAVEQATVELSGPSGSFAAPLSLIATAAGGEARGGLTIPAVARWWPHTHGEPVLHDVRVSARLAGQSEPVVVAERRVGFRELACGPRPDHDVERDGIDLHVNGTRVFARGAVWTPPDPVGLAPAPELVRGALERMRDAGMNMVRIAGTTAYESPAFHDLCDELGLLVWQDMMFANLDYPIADDAFRTTVAAELAEQLAVVAGRPSLAVVCGNSEVEQQVAMLGLDPALGRGELFGELLPALVGEAGADALYVPSAPFGGDRPFQPDRGVANYFGVGGYRRPLADARRAEVRFASECLAFSNVPDAAGIAELLPDAPADAVAHHPRWKAGVPRDAGSGWDFEDVRDHYLAEIYGVDPAELRSVDHDRYLTLSRNVTGEVMAAVFGEWRRSRSPCGGGLVLWLGDLAPGAGWGLLDSAGRPKAAYHHLRRALAPTAVWMTDEGLGGVAVHLAHDGPEPFVGRLRIALYRDFEQRVADVEQPLEIAAHGAWESDVETLLGRFVDASWAYRFGPPAQDLIVASVECDGDAMPVSSAVHFPAGRPSTVEDAERLGLGAEAARLPDGSVRLTVSARRYVHCLRVEAPGWRADDDALPLEPGAARRLTLHPGGAAGEGPIALTAANLRGRVVVPLAG
jgi:beta-mannosidase